MLIMDTSFQKIFWLLKKSFLSDFPVSIINTLIKINYARQAAEIKENLDVHLKIEKLCSFKITQWESMQLSILYSILF